MDLNGVLLLNKPKEDIETVLASMLGEQTQVPHNCHMNASILPYEIG